MKIVIKREDGNGENFFIHRLYKTNPKYKNKNLVCNARILMFTYPWR